MNQDPFYDNIMAGLAGKLDPDVFEHCAIELLRRDYPTAVPIRGGGDAGMDGAVGDDAGNAYPIICTTSLDVIGNVTKNLNSYLTHGGLRRVALVATSAQLTPRQRRNLEARATELGFSLNQVYERTAIADRLYRDPVWCRELLNLTGQPPALSRLSSTSSNRPQLSNVLIGRSNDLEWVAKTAGDRLIIGQPGCGKSFLLQMLVNDGAALFVNSDDCGEIANAIRSQQPSALIVDDAHVRLDLLRNLVHLRQEICADVAIVASTWPGRRDDVVGAMNLTTDHARDIGLLTRDEIVEVIKAAGVYGPNDLIRVIVDQADGRPGLAVTLVHLCLKGDVADVASGEALGRFIRSTFGPLVGDDAIGYLASFAVGGQAGIEMDLVAERFGVPLLQLQRYVAGLAAGGVINDVYSRLAVRPDELQCVLVRDVFFRGASSLPIEPLLAQIPKPKDAALVLIGARARGADVPDTLLRPLLQDSNSASAWAAYASLGPSECVFVLEHHPEALCDTAPAGLTLVTELTIDHLLRAAVGDDRPLNSAPEHALRILQGWVEGAFPGTPETVSRRSQLAERAKRWAITGAPGRILISAFAMCLSPAFEGTELDPGSGNTLTIRRGLLRHCEIEEVAALWPSIVDSLSDVGNADWEPLIAVLHRWAYPQATQTTEIADSLIARMRSICCKMVQDLVSLAAGHCGRLHRLRIFDDQIGCGTRIAIDPTFETLYPVREQREVSTADRDLAAVERLAHSWEAMDPVVAVSRLLVFEGQARDCNIRWPRHTPALCQALARRTQVPEAWLRVLLERDASADLIDPFLRCVVTGRRQGWEELLRQTLNHRTGVYAGVAIAIAGTDMPNEFIDAAMSQSEETVSVVEGAAMRREIPPNTLRRLLMADSDAVAGGAAIGLWCSGRPDPVPTDLIDAWGMAVVRCDPSEFWLGEILSLHPTLAQAWLERRLADDGNGNNLRTESDQAAAGALDLVGRLEIMSQLPLTYWAGTLIAHLVGGLEEVYRVLLADVRLKQFHLRPIGASDGEVWERLAVAALDADYSPEQVAGATWPSALSWCGPASNMWRTWEDRFGALLAHGDERIRQVGVVGIKQAQRCRNEALEREQMRSMSRRD
ncbi:MAG TPA: hypothetical protein VGM51_02625 [Armatimonadota bacterium]|jgi:hypothetical protein